MQPKPYLPVRDDFLQDAIYISDEDVDNDPQSLRAYLYLFWQGQKYIIQRATNDGYWVRAVINN